MKPIRILVLCLVLGAGCGDEMTMPPMGPMGPNGPLVGSVTCGGDTAALVAQSDYMTPGHASRIDFATLQITGDVLSLGEDAVLRRNNDLLYVINRFGITEADNIGAFTLTQNHINPAGPYTSTGSATNPQDIAVGDDGRVYAAEYGGPGIAILDAVHGQKVGEIDLSSLDPDGKPNLSAIYRRGGTLYAFAQLLDNMFTPRGNGKIAMIDLANGTLRGTIDMMSKNPATLVREEPGTNNVLVGTVDYAGLEGGVERIDLGQERSLGLLLTAQALGGRYVDDLLMTPSGKGYVVAVSPSNDSDVRTFMGNGTLGAPIFATGHYQGLALDGCNRLWVVDRGVGANATYGIRVWDTAADREVTTQPIHPSLPPVGVGGIVFVP